MSSWTTTRSDSEQPISGDSRVHRVNLSVDLARSLWTKASEQEIAFDDASWAAGYDGFIQRLAAADALYVCGPLLGIVERGGLVHILLLGEPVHMMDCASKMISFVFNDLNLHRMTAAIPAWNDAAVRLAARMDFQYEGTMRQALSKNGVLNDVFIFGLLRSEWEGN